MLQETRPIKIHKNTENEEIEQATSFKYLASTVNTDRQTDSRRGNKRKNCSRK